MLLLYVNYLFRLAEKAPPLFVHFRIFLVYTMRQIYKKLLFTKLFSTFFQRKFFRRFLRGENLNRFFTQTSRPLLTLVESCRSMVFV